MHFIYLSFAILSQLYPMNNLKALVMLQLPCCSCCLASFRDHAGYNYLKVSGGLGGLCMTRFGSVYSHFGKQRHAWILHCALALWSRAVDSQVRGNLRHQPQWQWTGSFLPTLMSLSSVKPCFLQSFHKGSCLIPTACNWYFGEPISPIALLRHCSSKPADEGQQGAGTALILWLHRSVCWTHPQQLWQTWCIVINS